MTTEDYYATTVALQRHEANMINAYRRHMGNALRAEADAYDLKALEADPAEARELGWIAFGLRIAAVKVEPRVLDERPNMGRFQGRGR